MRVMVDTNVLISAVYNQRSLPAKTIQAICDTQQLVFCEYIINECYLVIKRKFPQHLNAFQALLSSLNYELVAPANSTTIAMADPKDQPILDAALSSDIDTIVSGDKHFLGLDIEHLQILTPAEYLNIYHK